LYIVVYKYDTEKDRKARQGDVCHLDNIRCVIMNTNEEREVRMCNEEGDWVGIAKELIVCEDSFFVSP
jgi:hypothetical protein